jgi:hypothetical protein
VLRCLLLCSLQVFGEAGLLFGQGAQLGLHYLLLLAVADEEVDEPSLVLPNLRDLLLQMGHTGLQLDIPSPPAVLIPDRCFTERLGLL